MKTPTYNGRPIGTLGIRELAVACDPYDGDGLLDIHGRHGPSEVNWAGGVRALDRAAWLQIAVSMRALELCAQFGPRIAGGAVMFIRPMEIAVAIAEVAANNTREIREELEEMADEELRRPW